jgi:hydrogenase nickel incorporation protein HypB
VCITCGCSSDGISLADSHSHHELHVHDHSRDEIRAHAHDHPPSHTRVPLGAAHAPGVTPERVLQIEQDLLAKNNGYAEANRQLLAQREIFAVNLVSGPGSGKTSLLVETIRQWQGRTPVAVIEGDQQTSNDAERIRATDTPVVQINTGNGCHLDAHMIGHAIEHLQARQALKDNSLLLVENVGNLVCPAAFDLGEAHKAVILSVTEGEDKPLKYPDMFRAADVVVLSKIDLLPYLDFDLDAAIRYARQVNPDIHVIQLSTKEGTGFETWLDWLQEGCMKTQRSRA